jgi:hypothetical protein
MTRHLISSFRLNDVRYEYLRMEQRRSASTLALKPARAMRVMSDRRHSSFNVEVSDKSGQALLRLPERLVEEPLDFFFDEDVFTFSPRTSLLKLLSCPPAVFSW